MIRSIRSCHCLLLAGSIGFAYPLSAQQSLAPLQLGSPTVVGQDQLLGSIMGTALGADGSLFVVDGMNRTVSRLDVDGSLRWRRGGKGRGPGEFQLPSRVAVGPTYTVYVYDQMTGELSRFDSTGAYMDRQQLPFRFAALDDIVALASGGIAVSGVTETGKGAGLAIHLFDGDLWHIRSFGPLPETREPEMLRFWGAGWLTAARNGDILYVRKLPYEIYRFDYDGTLKQRILPPEALQGSPEDAIKVSQSSGSIRYEIAEVRPPMPQRALDLNGDLLTGWTHAGRFTIQLYNARGELVKQGIAPTGLESIANYDASRGALWGTGTVHDEPVLLRYQIDAGGF